MPDLQIAEIIFTAIIGGLLTTLAILAIREDVLRPRDR